MNPLTEQIFHRGSLSVRIAEPDDGCRLIRPRLPACLLLIGLLVSPSAWGTTCHVSISSGDDSNPGSLAAPWKTVARVNAATFAPGDRILFKRGDTWTGTGLVISSSGAAGNPIVYGAYPTSGDPKPVFASATQAGIAVRARHHVEIEDLAIASPAGNGVNLAGCDFVTVRRVEVADNGSGPGIAAVQGGNILIDACQVTNARNNGIIFKGSAEPKIHDSVIQNCVVRGTRANDGIVIHTGATPADTAGARFTIRHNDSEGSAEQGYDITTGTDILLEGNRSRQNRAGSINIGHSATRVTVRRHRAEDEPSTSTAQTIKITVPDVLIEHGVFIGSSAHNKPIINIVNGSAGEPAPEHVTLRHNTVVWNHPTGGRVFAIGPGVAMRHLTLQNNLWASRTGAGVVMTFAGVNPPSAPGFALDHNFYHSPSPTGVKWIVAGAEFDFAAYRQAFARDEHGLAADAKFVNAASGDFHLQPGSPALGTGAAPGDTSATASRPPGLAAANPPKPNIVLIMADDQGWGDTDYNGHPELKTPNLDALAASGLRLDRFYAAHCNCSPTRGSVLTGRHPNRYGTYSPGAPIRAEELTVAKVLQTAGYATGHFGKWHLNGKNGDKNTTNMPGRAILDADPLSPGRMGFDEWVSADNFFDLDPVLGRNGVPEKFYGDSSDITTDEALKFIRKQAAAGKPFLSVVWFGSPHVPHLALPADKAAYRALSEKEQNYLGEITAVDRSVGRLRAALRELKVADNTLLWYCSDNGGHAGPKSTGNLRGEKGSLWEGGLRVPGIVEWPARITKPFSSATPCSTLDIYPTVLEATGSVAKNQIQPLDGESLIPLFDQKTGSRNKPLPFWDHGTGHAAWLDWPYKLHTNPVTTRYAKSSQDRDLPATLLYNVSKDPKETTDLAAQEPERVAKMTAALQAWKASVEKSFAGADYDGRPTDIGRKTKKLKNETVETK